VIGEPQEKNPSTVMQALKLGFARRVLAEAKRKRNPAQSTLFEHTLEHIWQKRFYDFNVWTERKRIEKLRYMHRNPVKRGLVASPELWHWSSFRSRAYWRSLDLVSDCWSVDRSLAGLHRRAATLPQRCGIWFMPVVIVEGGLFGAILYPIVWQPQTPIAGTKDRRAIC
jgi:hypothetical protein